MRGLEYNTLYILIKEIAEIISNNKILPPFNSPLGKGGLQGGVFSGDEHMARISDLLVPFVEKAKRLLVLERHAMQKGHITYEKCDDPEIQKIRTELFSNSKSYGGMFKKLLDEIDRVLFEMLIFS